MSLNADAITGIGIQKPDDFVQNRLAFIQVKICISGFEQRSSGDTNDDFSADPWKYPLISFMDSRSATC